MWRIGRLWNWLRLSDVFRVWEVFLLCLFMSLRLIWRSNATIIWVFLNTNIIASHICRRNVYVSSWERGVLTWSPTRVVSRVELTVLRYIVSLIDEWRSIASGNPILISRSQHGINLNLEIENFLFKLKFIRSTIFLVQCIFHLGSL